MNRIKCIAAAGIAALFLAACSKTGEDGPDFQKINQTSPAGGATKEESGINDMLPPLSEDTRVISVEEAEKLISEDAGETTGE